MTAYEVSELSEMLKVSEKTVRDYCAAGKLNGRKWYVTEGALKEFFTEDEPDTTAP